METRPYDEARDLDKVVQIWREAGWIDSSDEKQDGVRAFYGASHGNVVPAEGPLEGVGLWSPARFRWMTTDLPVAHVAAILTGRAGRRAGYTTAVVNEVLAQAHQSGAALASLGAFEQGYYDRFGFGNSSYLHTVSFDPQTLTVDYPSREGPHVYVRQPETASHRILGPSVPHWRRLSRVL